MFPELSVDFMCCVSCPLWMNTCKSPTWKILTKPVSLQLKSRGVSAEERKRVFEELMKSLESSKS